MRLAGNTTQWTLSRWWERVRLLDEKHRLWSSFNAESVWSRPFVNNSSWPRSEAVLWLTVSAGGESETPGWTEGASHQSQLILSLSSQQIIIQELTSAQLGNLVNYLAGRCCLWRHYSAQMRAMINRSQGSLTFPCEVDSLKCNFFMRWTYFHTNHAALLILFY